ncbi:amino acid adenylation domain-containing protein [Streptomyces caelestis]|uniref:Amino acid adenylation domain-containing protein n=1 Tax=Streptomyces caelestis TaxID=36816 RepID=A0A7W9GYP4_9ACTN|nr:non-ribosomal peptide synthetase [Streptomyces caelestis]MBB5792500.1 amino acid adenylation domain-containing protein [Streptomyces caelestis]GGW70849.1 non-ribosomal peptide synthetase [Streptomyces caelestis]
MLVSRQFPLSAYQRDIWAAEFAVSSPDPQFNVVLQERLTGQVDTAALTASLDHVLRHTDAFALRFDDHDGVPHQWFAAEESGPWAMYVDHSGAADPAAACAEWQERSFNTPFRLRRSRLFTAAVLRESATVVHLHLNAHHLLADAYALNEISRRVWAEYARRTGAESAAVAVETDTAASSVTTLLEAAAAYEGSPAQERDRAHHREALAGVEPALFTAAPAPADGVRRRVRHSFTVEADLVRRIRQGGSSPFAFLTAAFAAYLARIHRSDEAVVGVPFLNRRGAAELAAVGQVANSLPVRVPVAADATLHQLAAQVRTTTDALRPHERLALGDLLRELPADPAGNRRLFDVTVSYLRFPRPAALPGLAREITVKAPVHAQDALSVMVHAFEDDADIRVDLDGSLDIFDEDFPLSSVAGHLLSLVRAGAERSERAAVTLPLLDQAEYKNLTQAWQGEDVPYADGRTVHGLIAEQAARAPGRIAVAATAGAGPLSYAELDARANQVARALAARGVGIGDRVAVLMDRSPLLIVALLGVLKAGGAYVPVDPGYPAERIRLLLEDSRAAVVLTSGDTAPTGPEAPAGTGAEAPAATVPVLPVETLLTGPDDPFDSPAGPHDLAYVIYTSGSTGRPKGVMVEHHSVINRLAWMQKRYPVGAEDVVLQKTPISFDVSVWELFWWAIEGAGLALLPVGGQKDPRQILDTIAEQQVTTLHFVPSMLGPFLDLLEVSPELCARADSLRTVFCSGEALPPARVEQFYRVFDGPGAPLLVNLYGPTEATVDVSYHDCVAEPNKPVRRVPIGRPVDNTRLYVLDAYGGLQPSGVPGELCIGGVQVARGYLDRPELTAEKFVEDPFTPGGRLYRTGDLARWLADGTLEYLGRIDGQVKIRGNRVELGEVQNRLASLPGVRDALVVDHTTPARGTVLAAYYVADTALSPTALRTELATQIPEFMVPAHFIRIERIPLTPNGKADRRALPAPTAGGASGPAGEPPRSPVEAELVRIWSEVLEVEHIGVHDDYYALGGDSITVLRIHALAEKAGIRFSVTDLMRYSTVAGLAAHATTTDATTGPHSQEAPLEPFALVSQVDRARLEGRADAHPLTRLQLGLLYHSRAEENSAVYHDVFQYSLVLPWDEDRFRDAFDVLVARHPVLRSSFDLGTFSEPLQIIDREAPDALDVADLRGRPEDEARAEILAHVEERRHHRYVFERAPLYFLRAHVLEESVELVLSFHHAILDGGSVATLLTELLQDYLHSLGHPVDAVDTAGPLPSAAHHVVAERRALDSADTHRFWQEYLAEAPLLSLEAFRPHEAPGHDGQITKVVDLDRELGEAARALAAERSLPVKSVLFAAHVLTLRLFSGTEDVTTGLVTHGRPELAGAERTTGLFLNTMPVRLDTSAARDWAEVAAEAFRQEQLTHPHRRYPLSAIQEDRGSTVLETAFNYIHFRQLAGVLALPGVRLREFVTWEETNFQLLVNAMTDPVDRSVRLRMDFHGQTFTEAQATLYAEAFTAILERIVSQPDETPDLSFLAPAPAGTDTRTTPTATATAAAPPDVVRALAEQTARTPEAVALAFGEREWTYAELDRVSARVARTLLGLGARPGARVGIAMDRSPETVAVITGVLRAGAAAVPLDVSYPAERLTSMVEQAEPLRVIAHRQHAAVFQGIAPVLPVEVILDAPRAGADEDGPELPAIDPAGTAYILFTSGSTGAPKGVAMPHRSLAQLVAWQNSIPSGVVGGRTAQFAPLSFDVSFQEIFSTLCGGGTLVVLTEEQRRDMPQLLRLLDRERVERICLPYVALQQFAEAADALGLVPRALKALLSSGEQLRVTDEIRRLCAALPGVVLENQYGPTESHVVTAYAMTGDPAGFPALPPIGTPITGSRVYVLDSALRPVPPGTKGELYLAGTCLADGYLGRPELTEERFLPDPFVPAGATGSPAARMYRTGDLGIVLPDGAIVCLGRADSQVKVRGYRVEPAEVELAITRFAAGHPGLAEAAVVARRREGGDSFLAAFLVGEEDRVDEKLLRKQLRTVLPEYLMPSHFEWIDALPLTPSGKRDDGALRRRPLTTAGPVEGGGAEPRDAYECTLTEILAELLQLPSVGIHDNLFALGGTSLTAMRLVVLIEQRFGINVPLSEFVSAPTAAELAVRLRDGGARTAFDPLVPIRTGGDRRPVFFVHPMGGNVLCYVRFASYLHEDQPFYALQAAGADPGTEPLRSVEEIAASYIEAIRRVQPSGPYVIGGWSFGGFVAFEMARQLRAAGEDIARLVLLDTTALNPGRRLNTGDEALLGWFFWELLWLRRGGDSPLELIPAELTTLDEKFDFIARLAIDEGVLPAGSTGAVVRRLFHVYEANWKAAFAYRPDPVDQDMILIHASEPLPEVLNSMHTAIESMHRDPSNGWRERTTGDLAVVDVPGDHLTLMEEPHVATTVRVVSDLIEQ